ncbi:MAG: DMT family transporter [Anaerolineales bacterium]|jgi:drug/metabolite transporter (DMT)-like permease
MHGLLLGVLASSTASIFIRYAQVEASSMTIAALRLSFASLILTPFVLARYRRQLLHVGVRNWLLAFAAGSFLALHFATWISSLEFTSVASSVALVQTTPLFVAIFSPLLLKETVGRKVAAGLLISILGSMIIAASDACTWKAGLQCPSIATFIEAEAVRGDMLAIFGALGAAGYLLIGRKIQENLDLIVYIFLVYSTSAFWLLIAAFVSGAKLTAFSSTTLVWILLLALIPQLLSHTTINWALRYLPAALVSVTLLGEPVASTIWAYIFLEETPPALRILGAVLVLMGIAVAAWRPPSAEKPGI